MVTQRALTVDSAREEASRERAAYVTLERGDRGQPFSRSSRRVTVAQRHARLTDRREFPTGRPGPLLPAGKSEIPLGGSPGG